MGKCGEGCKGNQGGQGSSLLYVVMSVTLLSVLSCGYMAISRYQMDSALTGRRYMEARLTAKSIHRTFCEAVSSGGSEAMERIWQCFEEDCRMVREEYDEMMEDHEEGGDIEDGDTGHGEESEWEDFQEGESLLGSGPEGRWERYLYHALGDKEYVMKGSAPAVGDGPAVDITLTALPLDEKARVHTEVSCNGYSFSMYADIVFDNSDGAVMTIGQDVYRRSAGDVVVRLNGNGVYRYYGD